MYKAYFRSDPASHSAFSEADIVDLHSATILDRKLSEPHDHNSVKLAMGGMPEHGMPLQHYVAADAEAYDQVAFIESNAGSTKQERWS
ncbi:hypothetical protein [Novosphingobium humi]|uniref:hypothetical protein n=1 Tax=Novosphingobium humi TaxID=2282397 RepID=UPI0025AF0279|nr:hypothetical protein [Novosphingobium humi]WJT00810.1 hypothetical protein NYQ05_16985 [Novosphingobium humi]